VVETVESAMSTKTSSPDVFIDEPSTVDAPADPGTDPALIGEDLAFESPEFGVGQFFPHLDAPTDG